VKLAGNRCSLAAWLVRGPIVNQPWWFDVGWILPVFAALLASPIDAAKTHSIFKEEPKDETPGMDSCSFDAGFTRLGRQETHRATTHDLLVSLQQDGKTDAEIATDLKQVELTEELTRAAMNKIINLVPGKFSIEQIYVLETRSATLAPRPPICLPTRTRCRRAESHPG